MIPFTRLTAVAAPLMRDNIDTDAIIAARSMEGGVRPLGPLVFTNWRLDEFGMERPGFVLNQDRFRSAAIMVAGRNFGCGSSRESAVWALMQYGFRAVVAPSFGDIFYENALQNGLVPVRLPLEQVEHLAAALQGGVPPLITLDLEACAITGPDRSNYSFNFDPERRRALMLAKDDFALLQEQLTSITAFHTERCLREPWLFQRLTLS